MAAESACIGGRARRYPPRSRVDRLASVALVSDGRPRSALAAVRRLKPRWRAPRGNGAHALPTPWDPGGALWPPTLKAADALREPPLIKTDAGSCDPARGYRVFAACGAPFTLSGRCR